MDRPRGQWRRRVWSVLLTALLACGTASPTSTVSPQPNLTTSTTVAPPVPTTPGATSSVATEEVVLVVGDFGTGAADEAAVAAAMEEVAGVREVEWLITTGDNFYTDDVEAAWSGPFGWVDSAEIEVIASLGNHDVETGTRLELVTDHLGIEDPWYRTEIGETIVLVLDANRPGDAGQQEWLENQLEDLDMKLVVVVFHQPAFSCGSHGGTPAVVEGWVPLFEEHDVDLVLNGHDHNYQRHSRAGVTYVVSGGGGAGLYQIGDCPDGIDAVVSDDTHHHFLVMTVLPGSIEVEARSSDGQVLDRFSIEN